MVAGLARRSPVLAATLTIFLLSLIGIPLTGGFFAKFYVFSAALQGKLIWLTPACLPASWSQERGLSGATCTSCCMSSRAP